MIIKLAFFLVFSQFLYTFSQDLNDQFGCPRGFRLNSVGEEVMNNENYIKYLTLFIKDCRKKEILYSLCNCFMV